MRQVFIIEEGQICDAVDLQRELIAAIGTEGWHVEVQRPAVIFTQTDKAATFDPAPVILAHFDNGKARAAAAAWVRIKAERDRRTQQGGYQVAGKWFHSDIFSRSQQLGLVLLGSNIAPGLKWKTMDGTFVAMTPALAQQVFAAAAASDQAVFSAAEAHRAAMESSADPAAYDFSAGWPPAFGE